MSPRAALVIPLPEDRRLDLGRCTGVMGVVNCTPDSFYDGGRHPSAEAAAEAGLAMLAAGAHVLDVGGESTRPGADRVPADEEMRRVVPVIERLRRETTAPVSVDTSKADVAKAALDAGADIINDVTAGGDPAMLPLAAERGAAVVLMHMAGTPRTMQKAPRYDDVEADVYGFLQERARVAEASGVERERILLDPGFGFGKTFEHNAALLWRLERLVAAGYPVVVGVSRKRMIEHALGLPKEERLEGSLALAALAAAKGAAMIRVHDVLETARAVAMIDAVRDAGETGTWNPSSSD